MATVATGNPVTIPVPKKAKEVAIAVAASGGTIDVTYRITEDDDPIDITWSLGTVADGEVKSTVVAANITSFKVTGDGTFNYRIKY